MKNECNIVRDLLPLCIEDMASPDSAVFVGKHLEQCADCRREMSRLKDHSLLEEATPTPEESEALITLQRKIKRHNRLLVTATTVVTVVVVSVLLVSLILYHLPQRRQVSMPVCNTNGEVSYLEIDVNYYRRLFSSPWVEGTVTLNGNVYYDSRSLWGPADQGEDRSYWDWAWYFGDPDQALARNLQFHIKDNDPMMAFQNYIRFLDAGYENSFNEIYFMYGTDDTNKPSYYCGPAQNIEEARQVAESLGWGHDWERKEP